MGSRWVMVCAAGLALALAACSGSESAGPSASSAATRVGMATEAPHRTSETVASTVTPTPRQSARPMPTVRPSATAGDSSQARVIRKGDASRNVVAFSFDAGSDVGYTAQILDTLKANGIRGSFGITGRWAEQNPDMLRRIVDEGHSLINHSYDHASFTGLSTGKAALTQAQRWEELDRTEAIIANLTGATTKPYFRPPYGDYDASVNADVGARGYAFNIMWTVDSGGWRGITADAIKQRCLQQAVPGAIYVFHVGSRSQDGPALQGIIDGLRERGYEIGDVRDALGE